MVGRSMGRYVIRNVMHHGATEQVDDKERHDQHSRNDSEHLHPSRDGIVGGIGVNGRLSHA